jgi:enoyl-[acyl-carrier protein] reductase III
MSVRTKKAVITGGSRGIGRETALRLAAGGAEHIIIGYCMNREAALQTVADVQQAGAKCSAIATDVGSEQSFRDFFARVAEETGGIDIFVSNAARASFQPLSSMAMRTWQRIVNLNASAFLLGSQLAADLMPRGGRMVGVSSLGSRFCLPGYGALGAAKAMMETAARYLAVELAPRGINVNVICGGMIDTDSTRALPDFAAVAGQVARGTPMRRVGAPADLARVITFLCSEDADWIRGQTLIADGGYSLGLGLDFGMADAD